MEVSEKIVAKAPISGDEPKSCFLHGLRNQFCSASRSWRARHVLILVGFSLQNYKPG